MARYFDPFGLQKKVLTALQTFKSDKENGEEAELSLAQSRIHIPISTHLIGSIKTELMSTRDNRHVTTDILKTQVFDYVVECLIEANQIPRQTAPEVLFVEKNAQSSDMEEPNEEAAVNEEVQSTTERQGESIRRQRRRERRKAIIERSDQARQDCDKALESVQELERKVNMLLTDAARATEFKDYQAAVADGECDLTVEQFHQVYDEHIMAEQHKLEAATAVLEDALEAAGSLGLDVSMYFEDQDQDEEEPRQPMADFPYQQYNRPLLSEAQYLRILRWSGVRCEDSKEMAKTIVSPTFERENPALPASDNDFKLHPTAGLLFPAKPIGPVFINLDELEPPAEDDMDSLPEGPDLQMYNFYGRHCYGGIDDPNNYRYTADVEEW